MLNGSPENKAFDHYNQKDKKFEQKRDIDKICDKLSQPQENKAKEEKKPIPEKK